MTHAIPLLAVATATPPHRFAQTMIRDAARRIFADRMRDFDRLAPVFTNSGIETRWSSAPLEWYMQPRGWAERNRLYLDSALDVLTRAGRQALDRAGLAGSDIDAVVTVSSTGIATPSLEARLMAPLGLRPDVQRLPLFGLGCAGGVLGLARAADWARAQPGRTVLLLVVELCCLSFRDNDTGKANLVATALFGDGGAAAVLRAVGPAGSDDRTRPAIRAWAEHTWPDTLDIMGWRVDGDGLGVIFAQSIPTLVRERFGAVMDRFLDHCGLTRADLAGSLCHPGGAKVVDALADLLAPCTDGLDTARGVLRDHGNMSAATVLFVLERRLAEGGRGPHLMTALGPGFTAALALLDL